VAVVAVLAGLGYSHWNRHKVSNLGASEVAELSLDALGWSPCRCLLNWWTFRMAECTEY
jgi:hypothetical protein